MLVTLNVKNAVNVVKWIKKMDIWPVRTSAVSRNNANSVSKLTTTKIAKLPAAIQSSITEYDIVKRLQLLRLNIYLGTSRFPRILTHDI